MRRSNENSTTYCNFDIIIIVFNIVVNYRIEIFIIARNVMSTTMNFKMFKISSMFFTKLIQNNEICFAKWLNREFYCLFSIIKNYHRIRYNSFLYWFKCFFLIIRFVIISRYVQSKFTSHKKLNCVKNIFKNCRRILLNNE